MSHDGSREAQGNPGAQRNPREILDPREILAQQLLFPSLTDKRTLNFWGFSGFWGFSSRGCGVKACSSPLLSPLSPLPRISKVPFPTSPAASVPAGWEPSPPSPGAFPGIPSRNGSGSGQSTPSGQSRPSRSCHRVPHPAGITGGCGGLQGTPGGCRAPPRPWQCRWGGCARCPPGWQGLCRSPSRCHRMMQHLQKRCRLPPTEGGGVTGAK